MREIKFRAWDTKTKSMYYFDIAEAGQFTPVELRRLKIMQYTGLTDTNGQEIYEGDIMASYEIGLEIQSEVVWFAGRWVTQELETPLGDSMNLYETCDDETLIGNAHQNPELLTPLT